MTQLNVNYSFWKHCFWLSLKFFKNIGPLGLAGLLITLGCGLFYVLMALPFNAQTYSTQQQLDNIKSSAITQLSAQEIPAKDMSQDIEVINKLLPQANTLHDWLGLIDKSAFKHGLRLNRGDYKFTQIKQGQVAGNQKATGNQKVTANQYASRYEIVLPVTGQYVQIRQFIANVLQSQPALALSSVKIQRDNTLATNVEARLVFVLFLQGDSL